MSQGDKKIFLYKKVYLALKNRIDEGKYDVGDLLPTENEIGGEFGVDRTTVRKAISLLQEEKLVEKLPSKGTIVCDKISNLMYSDDKKNNLDKRIAFIFYNSKNKEDTNEKISQSFYSEIFYSIELECQKYSYSLVYTSIDDNQNFKEFIKENNFSAIFFISDIPKKYLDIALELKVPSLLINNFYSDMTSLMIDNFLGAYTATSHLIELGHKDIMLIKGKSNFISNKERLYGAISALEENNIKIDDELILDINSWELIDSFNYVSNFLKTRKKLPTAIFAFNDRLAVGALQAIIKFGLKVPEDISIIGFDNSEIAQFSFPKLSSIEIFIPTIAKVATDYLMQQINHYSNCSIKILTPITLIKSESTRKNNT